MSALVVDVGTYCTKAGFAGEDTPKHVFPSCVGAVSQDDNDSSSKPAAGSPEGDAEMKDASDVKVEAEASKAQTKKVNKKYFVGNSALNYRRDNMAVEAAMSNGLAHDWDAMEAIWEHIYKDCLNCTPGDHPLLVSEPSFNTTELREQYTEMLFEKMGVPALFIGKNAVLSSFASGRGTAVVLDVGHSLTTSVAVHDGYLLHKSLHSSPVAGAFLTNMLRDVAKAKDTQIHPNYSLKRKEVSPATFECTPQTWQLTHSSFHDWHQLEVLRDMKEAVCTVSDYALVPESVIEGSSFELPDKTTLTIGSEKQQVPEMLFNPHILKAPLPTLPNEAEHKGIATMLHETISSCDPDIRRELYNSVIVTGGCSLFPGLCDRLHKQLSELVPQMMSMKVKVIASNTPAERRFSVWIGGSILASLGSFQQLWISKAEYEEHGASILERKCP